MPIEPVSLNKSISEPLQVERRQPVINFGSVVADSGESIYTDAVVVEIGDGVSMSSRLNYVNPVFGSFEEVQDSDEATLAESTDRILNNVTLVEDDLNKTEELNQQVLTSTMADKALIQIPGLLVDIWV